MTGDFAIGGEVWPGVSKLIEEMGELNQVLGKLIATRGEAEHWDGSNLHDRVHDEAADVLAALRFVEIVNGLDSERIALRAAAKFAQFLDWHADAAAPGAPR